MSKFRKNWEKVGACGPPSEWIPTGVKMADGPYCGRELMYDPDEMALMVFDTTLAEWVVISGEEALEGCVQPDVEECCTDAIPMHWCQALGNVGGNGDEGSSYSITVNGTETELPVDFGPDDILAAVVASGGTWDISEDGFLCRYDQQGGIVISGFSATTNPDGGVFGTLFRYTAPQLPRPAVPAVCTKYGRVWTKREDDIAFMLGQIRDMFQMMLATLTGIFDKACEQVLKLCEILNILKKPKFQIVNGYDCDTNRPVWWHVAIDCDGNVVYPNGAVCPEFFSGELVTVETESCSCNQIGFAKAIAGFGGGDFTTAGSGTDTHTVTFDSTIGAGVFMEQELQQQIATGNPNLLCIFGFGDGANFIAAPASLQGSNGNYTATRPVTDDSCFAGLVNEYWPQQMDASGTQTGQGVRCISAVEANCVTLQPDCTAPLDPQPTRVKLGAPPLC